MPVVLAVADSAAAVNFDVLSFGFDARVSANKGYR
jgi:hypothetical protein